VVWTVTRGLKDTEQDISSIEKRFAYGFLQKLLKWMDIAQEFIAHLGMLPPTTACDQITTEQLTLASAVRERCIVKSITVEEPRKISISRFLNVCTFKKL